jgi:TetR/AcrR family transcriptional regulator, lmrAB and yxaGH operons repressor
MRHTLDEVSMLEILAAAESDARARAAPHSPEMSAGRCYLELFDLVHVGTGNDPAQSIRNFFQLSIDALEKSGFADGCPVTTVALEVASTSTPFRRACDAVFVSWQQATAALLTQFGAPPDRAADLATYILAAFEGAIILSRTAHDTRPLRITADLVGVTIRAQLAAR